MSNMKKWNYIISAITLLLGAVVVYLSSQFPVDAGTGDPGAGFWPKMLGILLIGLAALLAISNTVKGEQEKAKTFALTSSGNRRAYLFMALIVCFCVALYFLGFVIASLLFIPCAMWMLGVRSKPKLIITPIIVVAMIYFFFRILLKTPLPDPIFMR